MTRRAPDADCYDLGFLAGYPLNEPAEVALEDYARVLTRSRGAEAMRKSDDPSVVEGVHICGLGSSLTQAIITDLEDFARGLVVGRGGLGWS